MAKPHNSIRIFKSDFCEFFTHVHPITPLLIWLPVVCGFFYYSFTTLGLSAWAVGGYAGIGLFIWTIAEYALHRFIFHIEATSPVGERLMFIMHGIHHADPVDPTRLVMPPFMSVILATVLFYTFRMLLGPVYIFPFFAAFLIGYLCYDYTHYAIHHFKPRTRIGKMLKQHHMAHHFITPDARFGVSSPIWDYFLGSNEEAERVQHGS